MQTEPQPKAPEGLPSVIPDRVADAGPSWLVMRRREALASLAKTGFPGNKLEAWRFTSVRPIVSVPFAHAESYAPVVDAPSGVEVVALRDALSGGAEWLEPYLGRIAPNEHFVALATALFADGVAIRVPRGVSASRPIRVAHTARPGEAPRATYPRLVVVAEEGSAVRIVETFASEGSGTHLTVPVAEIAVGPNASVDHVRVAFGDSRAFHLGTVAVREERDARFTSHVVTMGGGITRVDLRVVLDGEGAECSLDGLYLAGASDHVDHQTWVEHAKPHGTSQQSYRGVLFGRAHGVFDGTVIVRKDAQQTVAHQENRNLLLSNDAVVNTKPHLEIDADDVKCSHGATIGALDETQLFYLRARGIDAETARAVLTLAFARTIVERIGETDVRDALGDAIRARLPGGSAVVELP